VLRNLWEARVHEVGAMPASDLESKCCFNTPCIVNDHEESPLTNQGTQRPLPLFDAFQLRGLQRGYAKQCSPVIHNCKHIGSWIQPCPKDTILEMGLYNAIVCQFYG
jgi:hypothetical protein